MTRPRAVIVADSMNVVTGHRLTTWELRYWRAVHDELLTHREFSRCTASSRAVPFEKMCASVVEDPALPVEWGSNRPGMQPGDEIDDEKVAEAREIILELRDVAVAAARKLHALGLHKQIVNRYIQPWAHTSVLVSTTSHSNWEALRCHPAAQADIRAVAVEMREVLAGASPVKRGPGELHLPYVSDDELSRLGRDVATRVSVGRCARVSYMNHGAGRDPAADEALYWRLVGGLLNGGSDPGHMSPLEHVAEAMETPVTVQSRLGASASRFSESELRAMNDALVSSGNFRGWKQHRKTWVGEYVGGVRT